MSKIVAVDFETHLIAPGMVTPRPVCLSWADGETSGLLLRDDTHSFLTELLENSDDTIVGHEIVFDLGVACAEWPELLPAVFEAYERDRIVDTKIVQQLIDIANGELKYIIDEDGAKSKTKYHLSDLAWRHLKVPLEKKSSDPNSPGYWRLRYCTLDGKSLAEWPKPAVDYAVGDAVITRDIFLRQLQYLKSITWTQTTRQSVGSLPDVHPQCRAAWWLHLASIAGLRTDPVRVEKLDAELQKEMAELRTALEKYGIFRSDGTKNLTLIRDRVVAACEKRGAAIPKTDKGAITYGKETLNASGDPALVQLATYFHAEKIHSTWLPHLRRGTKYPVCPRYNVLVESGRTSSSGPNIQNPHREGAIRPAFVARRGRVWISSDYDTVELRALADICLKLFGTSALAEAFVEKRDPHHMLGGQLLNLTYDEVVARKSEKIIKDMRQLGKVGNYGIPGGLSAPTLMLYAHNYDPRLKDIVDLSMATRIHSSFFQTWPEMNPYFNHIKRLPGMVIGEALVHQAVSNRLRGACSFTQAANTMFQGLVADGAKRAGWYVSRACYVDEKSPLYGSRIVAFLHDEIITETPEEKAAAAAAELEKLMIKGMCEFIERVPVTCSPAIVRRWWKGAEAVYVSGIMVPSMPIEKDGKIEWVHDDGVWKAAA